MNEPGKSGHGLPSWMPTFVALNGVALAWWEAVYDHFERPYFYVLVGVMMAGMPAQLIEAVVSRFTGGKRGAGES
jgi:hypothetical protein